MAERELTPRAAAREIGRHWRTIIRMYDRGELRGREVRGPKGRRRIYIPLSELTGYTERERSKLSRTPAEGADLGCST